MWRGSRASAWLFASALALAPGCGGAAVPPAADVHLVTSAPAAEVDAIVAAFFGQGGPTVALEARLRDALLRYPDSGALHEVAAYWAVLQSDDHAAWEHFLRAAADTQNPDAAVDILELARGNRTRSELVASVPTLARIADASPDAEVQARARYARAGCLRMLGRRDEARQDLARLGFVQHVQLLGAFDNEDGKGLAEAYPPESKIDLAASAPGSVLPVRWRSIDQVDTMGLFPLQSYVYPNQGAVAYVAFWVRAPRAMTAALRISTQVPSAAWVNHVAVAREDHVQHWGLDNVVADVTLEAGWNEILVKSAIKTGGWDLSVRLTDPAGNVLPDLLTSVVPEPVPTAVAPPPRGASPRPTPRDRRAAFVAARRLVATGLYQAGLGSLEKLLSTEPANPILRFFAADAAEHDHQLERALDLLASGITQKEALPAFLSARAGIYLAKDLLTQAQRDLVRVVTERPGARLARMQLADVLAKLTWQADRVTVLNDVIRRWPDSAYAYVSLGAAREAQGYAGGAEEAYRTAVAIEPSNVGALRALRRLLEARRATGELESVFERLAEVNPTDIPDELARAEHERTMNRPRSAEARRLDVSTRSPDHPMPYLRRGLLAEERGDEPSAIGLFQRAQERDPRDSWLAQRLEHLRPPADDALRPYVVTDEQIERAVGRASVKGDTASHVQTLLDDTATLLNSDGSVRMVVTEVLRALTQRGRDELVHMALPGGGTVRVLKAYAETPDGKRQEASSVERTSIRFRNLEVGSTVVLQYAAYPRRAGALADDYFRDAAFSTLARHIDRMRWVVVASRRKALSVDADPRVKHTVTENPDWIVHEFVRENVPAIPAELSMVPLAELQAHVVVTTVPSWDSFIRWEKAIIDESFPADPAIDALAARLTAGAATPKDRLGKLFAYVAQEIRYQQEYESILAGWQPHRSSVVLERKYGDCKDKATLLIALARSIGIDLQFVVLATHSMGRPDRTVVLPHFNHAIAYVPVQPGFPEPFFLDATVDALDLWNLRDDDQGAAGLVMDPKSGSWSWIEIPYQAPSYQEQRWKVDVDVTSPEEVTARSHLELRGSHASSLRALLRNEDQSRQVYDLLASACFPGGRVISASAPDHESLTHPLVVDEEIDAAASIRQEGEHFRLKFPNDTDGAQTQTKLSERQTPLDLGLPRSSVTEIVVHLGTSVRLREKPASVDVTDPCFHIRRTVTGDASTVTLKDELDQTCPRVSVTDYPRYRAAMDRARSLLDTAVVFDRVAGGAGASGQKK